MRNRLIKFLYVILCIMCICQFGSLLFAYDNSKLIEYEQKTNMMDKDNRKKRAYELFLDGEKSGNILVQAFGSTLLGFHFLIENEPDSALFFLNNTINIYEKYAENASIYEYRYIASKTYNYLALYYLNYSWDYYNVYEYLYKSLQICDEDNSIYPLLLANLTMIHYFKTDTCGFMYANMLKDWSDKHGGKNRFHAEYSLASMYFIKQDLETAKIHAYNAIDVCSDANESYNRELIFAYNLLGKILLEQDDKKQALSVLNKAVELVESGTVSDVSDTWLLLGNLYIDEEEYDLALQVMQKGLQRNSDGGGSSAVHFSELLERISFVYALKGDYEAALEFYRKYHKAEEAVYDRNKEYAIAEMRAKYNLGEYENRLKDSEIRLLKKNRSILVLVFVIVVVVWAWYSYYRKNKYYERIVKTYQWQSIGKDKYNKSCLSETEGKKLWGRVCQCMEDGMYRDEELTIDKLAANLSTNRTYLSRVINENAGMNFSQYVNKYRIDEAVKRMMESKGECLLKTMAFDLGFKSTSGFNKAFQKEIGMPPATFRNKFRNLNN